MRWGNSYTENLRYWHPWWAWYPVRLNSSRWVWLEWVSCRCVLTPWEYFWQYRLDDEDKEDGHTAGILAP